MYAALVGEVDGVRLISPERLREISAAAFAGTDQIMGNPVTWALGFSVGQLGSDAQQTPTVFGMGGVGGSFAYADTAAGVAFALTKNRLTADFSAAQRISDIVTETVGG
jgi:CubicO group peptidase (beta-lactamase class C family)